VIVGNKLKNNKVNNSGKQVQKESFFKIILNNLAVAALTIIIFHLSLLITSSPVESYNQESIDRAVALLEAKGFDREVFLLRRVATFRGSDNWLNLLTEKENAYAATNFPFAIITLYPDFYTKTEDDTERAMILLHEVQHLKSSDEAGAYEYVWRNREKLGWTTLSHGTTPTFVTIELQTRENSPHLFTCQSQMWDDCTENFQVRQQVNP
jgi:hypothetical protein